MKKLFSLSSLSWSYDPSHLQVVENIYYGNAEIPSAITERDILNVLKLDRLNGDVIDSFICSLISKQQYLRADAISSILSQIFANKSPRENRSIFMKYLKKTDLIENDIVLVTINVKS